MVSYARKFTNTFSSFDILTVCFKLPLRSLVPESNAFHPGHGFTVAAFLYASAVYCLAFTSRVYDLELYAYLSHDWPSCRSAATRRRVNDPLPF